MKLFKSREPLPRHPYLLAIERADRPKKTIEFLPLARIGEQKQKNWLKRFLEKCFDRQKHKIEQ